MQKEEQPSRQIVICYLMTIMRIDVEEELKWLLKWKKKD